MDYTYLPGLPGTGTGYWSTGWIQDLCFAAAYREDLDPHWEHIYESTGRPGEGWITADEWHSMIENVERELVTGVIISRRDNMARENAFFKAIERGLTAQDRYASIPRFLSEVGLPKLANRYLLVPTAVATELARKYRELQDAGRMTPRGFALLTAAMYEEMQIFPVSW